jgi:hypothetical protein
LTELNRLQFLSISFRPHSNIFQSMAVTDLGFILASAVIFEVPTRIPKPTPQSLCVLMCFVSRSFQGKLVIGLRVLQIELRPGRGDASETQSDGPQDKTGQDAPKSTRFGDSDRDLASRGGLRGTMSQLGRHHFLRLCPGARCAVFYWRQCFVIHLHKPELDGIKSKHLFA